MENEFKKPTFELLEDTKPATIEDDSKEVGEKIVDILKKINISCTIKSYKRGGTYTSYICSIQLPSEFIDMKESIANNENPLKILNKFEEYIEDEIGLDNSVSFIIPKKGNEVEMQVSNKKITISGLKSKFSSKEFQEAPMYSLYIGEDVDRKPYIIDALQMPQMIMCGYTGTGKSVELASIILSLMLKCTPRDAKFLFVDPKCTEFDVYNESPYSLTREVIKDKEEFFRALDWLNSEMKRRMSLFSMYSKRDIVQYNEEWYMCMEYLPRIFVVIDEIADFVYEYEDEIKFKECVNKIASLSRATGIHFIVATQRPNCLNSTDIDKLFPTKISFRSDYSLNGEDPTKLCHFSEMYFSNYKEQKRLQTPYVTSDEIGKVCSYVKAENESNFDPLIEKQIHPISETPFDLGKNVLSDDIKSAIKISIGDDVEAGWISISKMQRAFGWGWPKAAKVFDQLKELHIYSDKNKYGQITLIISNEEAKKLCGKKSALKIYTLSKDMLQVLSVAQTYEDGILNNLKIQLGFGWKSARALNVLSLLKALPVFEYVDEDTLKIVGSKKDIQEIIDQAIIQ